MLVVMDDNGIIKLVTEPERTEAEEQAYRAEVNAEALAMLDRARELILERDAKVTGLAVAFVFDDHHYGRLTPTACADMAGLIGSVGTLHHDLILSTLVPSR